MEQTSREKALNWWNFEVLPFNTSKKEYTDNKVDFTAKYYPNRFANTLTEKEIESIYLSEIKEEELSKGSNVESAARKQFKNVGYDGNENPLTLYMNGATFAESCLQPIIDSHAELLEALKPFATMSGELTESKVRQGGNVYQYQHSFITVADLIRAAAVLAKGQSLTKN